MALINDVAQIFFHLIETEAKELALEKFLKTRPEILGRNGRKPSVIELSWLKINETFIKLPDKIKEEYYGFVQEEIYELTLRMINNAKEKKND